MASPAFGVSVADFVASTRHITRIGEEWRETCGEYSDITDRLGHLSHLLKNLEVLIHPQSGDDPLAESILVERLALLRELITVISACRETVKDVEGALTRFKRLNESKQRNWKRVRLPTKDLESLRSRLAENTSTVEAYLNMVTLEAIRRVNKNETAQSSDFAAALGRFSSSTAHFEQEQVEPATERGQISNDDDWSVDTDRWPYEHEEPPLPPNWLQEAIATLRGLYPESDIVPVMKIYAVNITSGETSKLVLEPGALPPSGVKLQYRPRIRCNDCPGKLYIASPGQIVDDFQVHLRNSKHREQVENRQSDRYRDPRPQEQRDFHGMGLWRLSNLDLPGLLRRGSSQRQRASSLDSIDSRSTEAGQPEIDIPEPIPVQPVQSSRFERVTQGESIQSDDGDFSTSPLRDSAGERVRNKFGRTSSQPPMKHMSDEDLPVINDDTTVSKSTQVFSSHGRTEVNTAATSLSLDTIPNEDKGVGATDRLTIRSRASDTTLNLPESEEQQLITVFVQQLWQTMHRLVGHIPEGSVSAEKLEILLKLYSDLMRHTVSTITRFEKGAVHFVRSRRRKIARRFSTLGRRSSDASEDSLLKDKSDYLTTKDISSWLQNVGDIDAALENAIDLDEPTGDANRISDLLKALPDMQRFLMENEAWRWFESQLLRTNMAQPSPSRHIMDQIQERGIVVDGPPVRIRFELEWQPRVFLQQQYPQDAQPDIGDVITLVGSEGRIQVTTCGAYIDSTWPTVGVPLLRAVRTTIRNERKETIQLPHNASATIELEHEHLVVEVSAFPELISDIGELLAWIGAACRASPYERKNCFCAAKPFLSKSEPVSQEHIRFLCTITYDCQPFELPGSLHSDCWLPLFRNVSIADGFFVPTRLNGEQGLEITLPLMILLGDTPWVDTFNNNFLLKGFSTMFVPKQVLPGSILWHFQQDENDSFMSYANGRSSCINKSSVNTADISWLYQQRHYIGWTSKAESHLGKDCDLYSDIENPDASPPTSGMALETTTISGGYHLEAWQTYSKAYCQQPRPAPKNDDYVRHLIHLSESNFILYDTKTRRAWLVDGASALLHITCCQLRSRRIVEQSGFLEDVVAKYATHERKPLSVLKDPENRRYILRQEYDDDLRAVEADIQLSKPRGHTFNDIFANDQAQIQNGDIHNTTTNNFNFAIPPRARNWRFQDLVASNYNYLIKAQDQERLNSEKIRFTDRDQLEGWSFLDIVNQSSFFIKPRLVYLQPSGRSWTGYTRAIEAVTLMADGFGDLMTPCEIVCEHWMTVPKGLDYLATTVERLIYNSGAYGRKKYFPTEIAKEVRWHQPSDLFDSCRCPENGCDPVQVILPRLRLRTRRPDVALENYRDGGVIFGKSKKFRMWFPRDAHLNPEMVSQDTVEYSDPEEDVRRQSLDSEFQVPLTEYGSTAPRSDDPLSDLRSAATASDLPLETPATSLDQTSTSDIATKQSRVDAFSKRPVNPVVASSDQATSHGKLNLGSLPVDYGEELSTLSSAQGRQAQPFTRSKSGILGRLTAFGKRRRK